MESTLHLAISLMYGRSGSNKAEETFDIVDEHGQPTGETVTRTQEHAEGFRHRTAHIRVVRKNGDKTVLPSGRRLSP